MNPGPCLETMNPGPCFEGIGSPPPNSFGDHPLVFPQSQDVMPILLLLAIGSWLAGRIDRDQRARRQVGPVVVITLLGYVGLDLAANPPGGWDHVLGSVLRAFLIAGVVLVGGRITIVVVSHAYAATLGRMFASLHHLGKRVMRWWRSLFSWGASRREARRAAVSAEAFRRDQERRAQADRQRQVSETDAQTRRENARAEVELFIATNASRIPPEFGPAFVAEYLKRYLADVHPPAVVETRATRLMETILAAMTPAKQATTGSAIAELSSVFEARRLEIEALPLSPEMKEHLLFKLRLQLSESIEQKVRSEYRS